MAKLHPRKRKLPRTLVWLGIGLFMAVLVPLAFGTTDYSAPKNPVTMNMNHVLSVSHFWVSTSTKMGATLAETCAMARLTPSTVTQTEPSGENLYGT
jgi:hypothetical protein